MIPLRYGKAPEVTHKPIRDDAGQFDVRWARYTCEECGTQWPCEPYRTQPVKRGGEKRRGTANGRTKLTPAQVRAARDWYVSGVLSQHAIARILGVDNTTIRDCILRENWKSVE